MPRPRGGYRNSKGVQVPGCTTIISRFKDSGSLLYWAFNQGKSGAESLYEESDKAAEIGTLTHGMFEAHRTGREAPKPPPAMLASDISKAETAFLNALEWERQMHVESVEVEASYVCEHYQYGCTIDEIARVGGKLIDFEWKTSSGIYLDHLLQTAAQKHCWECNHPGQHLEGAGIIRWSKESPDFAYHFYSDFEEIFEQFVRFRACYDADQKLKRRAR